MGTLLAFHCPGSPQPLTTSPDWEHMHWELQLPQGMGRAGCGHQSHECSGSFHSPPWSLWLWRGRGGISPSSVSSLPKAFVFC